MVDFLKIREKIYMRVFIVKYSSVRTPFFSADGSTVTVNFTVQVLYELFSYIAQKAVCKKTACKMTR